MQEQIGVILPVYKGDKQKYLQNAIDSILNQTYCNFKLFIGVDGPISGNLFQCLSSFKGDDRVQICKFEVNRGLACVLNDLLAICFEQGIRYIARMDADDIALTNRFEKQMSFMLANPDIDVVGGAITEIDENGNDSGKIIVYPATPSNCRAFFAKRNPLAHPAVLFRKSFFEKADCKYRPEYRQNQDTMLWYDGLMKDVQMANIQDVVLLFRITDSLFKKRRNGWDFAKKQLQDRKMINRDLHYGFGASIFAYAMFCLLISPSFIKKFAYKIFR